MTTTDPASHDGRDLEEDARVNTPTGQLREELFGPVLTVQVIGDDSESLRIAQASRVSGSGRDESHAMAEYTDLKTTWINYG